MARKVIFEWDVETVDVMDAEHEIIDHHFCGSYEEAVKIADEERSELVGTRIVLVRDEYKGDHLIYRAWAYVKPVSNAFNAKVELPEYFDNAWDTATRHQVPQHFHREIAKHQV